VIPNPESHSEPTIASFFGTMKCDKEVVDESTKLQRLMRQIWEFVMLRCLPYFSPNEAGKFRVAVVQNLSMCGI